MTLSNFIDLLFCGALFAGPPHIDNELIMQPERCQKVWSQVWRDQNIFPHQAFVPQLPVIMLLHPVCAPQEVKIELNFHWGHLWKTMFYKVKVAARQRFPLPVRNFCYHLRLVSIAVSGFRTKIKNTSFLPSLWAHRSVTSDLLFKSFSTNNKIVYCVI